MQFISDGATLFAQQTGAGPDVVLLHPTPVDHTFWLPVAWMLEPAYRVWMPDLRGHGNSELTTSQADLGPSQASAGRLTIELMARDIVAMMREARIERALFAGCSIGSYLLFELWRQIPERIEGLAFCCGKPQADSPDARAQRARTIEEIERQGTSAFFERMLQTLVGEPAARSRPAMLTELRRMMERMQPEAVIATQRALGERPDSVRAAATIRVPAMVLAGALDPASTPAEMKQLADVLPNAEFHLLQELGHYAPYERPDVVGTLLRRFCDSVPRSR
ncbi:MAG: alpha/beta fold hydrolase [Acidobacteriaceae bacterium]